jgi:hypothetical protein
VREAAALWAKLREVGGPTTRDRVWSHPDFLPGSSELDDPDGFVAAFTAPEPDMSAFDELTRPGAGSSGPDDGTGGASGDTGDSSGDAAAGDNGGEGPGAGPKA